MKEAWCRIELFGGVRARQGGETLTKFRTHKAVWLLGYLALHLHESVPRERVLDLFWPDLDLDAARDNLSTVLSSLRRQLDTTPAVKGQILQADRESLRLNPEAVETDVEEAEGQLRRAREADSPGEEAAALERVAAIYKGELLPGCYDDWALALRESWAERFVVAMERWGAALERLSRLEDALRAYERALHSDEFREEACRAVMRLHATLGHPHLAIEQYERLLRRLEDQWGASPAEETQRLAERIRQNPEALRSVSSPSAAPAGDVIIPSPLPSHPPAAHVSTYTLALPAQLNRFFGRHRELEELEALLEREGPDSDAPDIRLFTLTGPGGVGKTRLSIEWARRVAGRFHGRVWFVPLESVTEAHAIPSAIAQALHLAPSGSDLLSSITEMLGARESLLLLDNFEQLLEDAAEESALFVRDLLAANPG
jgi:DNA-binding SARP family transcriptional activator